MVTVSKMGRRGLENIVGAVLLVVLAFVIALVVAVQLINIVGSETAIATESVSASEKLLVRIVHTSIVDTQRGSQVRLVVYNPTDTTVKVRKVIVTTIHDMLVCDRDVDITVSPHSHTTITVTCGQINRGTYIVKIVLEGGGVAEKPTVKP